MSDYICSICGYSSNEEEDFTTDKDYKTICGECATKMTEKDNLKTLEDLR